MAILLGRFAFHCVLQQQLLADFDATSSVSRRRFGLVSSATSKATWDVGTLPELTFQEMDSARKHKLRKERNPFPFGVWHVFVSLW